MVSQYGNTYYGLDADKSKLAGVALNGRKFVAMDVSKEYYYDAENEQWIEWVQASGSDSEPVS